MAPPYAANLLLGGQETLYLRPVLLLLRMKSRKDYLLSKTQMLILTPGNMIIIQNVVTCLSAELGPVSPKALQTILLFWIALKYWEMQNRLRPVSQPNTLTGIRRRRNEQTGGMSEQAK
ncbi:hypothetical protein VTN00DRAFT_2725 [Thermoascus crustaceus]|uniref:uncharacterized protein n=1 Tax=Thermoascus crustaceus TaxID=5088 RepID=UPI0037439CE9